MARDDNYARHIEPRLKEALEDSPVVLIQGARQCGKTTLARMVGEPAGYAYRSFDDEDTRSFAEMDPIGFVRDLPEHAILDEVQKVPRIFSSLKLSIDRNRTPGRFLLTGSVNVLQVRQITDSLAGRMEIIKLYPFSQSELERTAPRFLDALFSAELKRRKRGFSRRKHTDRIVAGGYPDALRRSGRRRSAWYRNYIKALAQHDVPGIANIRSPEILSRLLVLATAQTAQLLNTNGLASSFQISRKTTQDYLFLLEKMFLLERLPAWHTNRRKRLIKAPKLHVSDTGIACALMNLDGQALMAERSLFGHILETFVLQELKRQASGHEEQHGFFHYREKDGAEADIVIQRGATALAGVEVKASATVNKSDFRGLHMLKAAAGKRFVCGVVLYNGEEGGRFGDGLYALPLQTLWETA